MVKWIEGVRVAAVLGLGGFVLLSAAQAGCSAGEGVEGTSPEGETSDACPTGQTARKVDGTPVCCSGQTCTSFDALLLGSSCSSVGETRTVDQRTFATGTCVQAACTGDTTSNVFALSAKHDVGTLVCAKGSRGASWAWKTAPAEHVVERACVVTGPLVCGADGYGYGYGYGYGSSDGNGDANGYGDSSGYGYGSGDGYGDASAVRRAIVVTSDSCSKSAATGGICTDGL